MGGVSVQLGGQNSFGRILVDQTIEETVNRDTQTAGGTKGFSLKRAAVERYYLTSEYRSTYLKHLRQMVERGMSHLSHPDMQRPRITRDEADVQSMVKLLEDDWTNPFDPNESDLVIISTGTMGPPDVTRSLLDAHKTGTEAYKKFKQNRLEVSNPKTQFHDKITKKRLNTFSVVVMHADRKLFDHIVLVADSSHL